MAYSNPADQASYMRQHYLLNKPAYLARARAKDVQTRIESKLFIMEYLATHPCVDCGEEDIIVLEFDHLPGTEKRFNIADYGRRKPSLKKLADEINKCEVRCANCHRRVTHKRRAEARNQPEGTTRDHPDRRSAAESPDLENAVGGNDVHVLEP